MYFRTAAYLLLMFVVSPGLCQDLETSSEKGLRLRSKALMADCDCNDPEALYHKTLRQIINQEGFDKMEQFLDSIRPQRICGSDKLFYRIKCELLCTKANNPEKADLHEVRRKSLCRKRLINSMKDKPKFGQLKMDQTQADDSPNSISNNSRAAVCICTRHYSPVCGSNGVTYGNQCTFECAQRYVDPDIVITAMRKCDEADQTAL